MTVRAAIVFAVMAVLAVTASVDHWSAASQFPGPSETMGWTHLVQPSF
jgi:hypothetical protein